MLDRDWIIDQLGIRGSETGQVLIAGVRTNTFAIGLAWPHTYNGKTSTVWFANKDQGIFALREFTTPVTAIAIDQSNNVAIGFAEAARPITGSDNDYTFHSKEFSRDLQEIPEPQWRESSVWSYREGYLHAWPQLRNKVDHLAFDRSGNYAIAFSKPVSYRGITSTVWICTNNDWLSGIRGFVTEVNAMKFNDDGKLVVCKNGNTGEAIYDVKTIYDSCYEAMKG